MERIRLILVATVVLLPSIVTPSAAQQLDWNYAMTWAKYRVSERVDTRAFHTTLPGVPGPRLAEGRTDGLTFTRTAEELDAERLRFLTPELNPGRTDAPKWLIQSLGVASEGLAFYAALRADNKPAMAAVAVMALTGGMTGQSLREATSKLILKKER